MLTAPARPQVSTRLTGIDTARAWLAQHRRGPLEMVVRALAR